MLGSASRRAVTSSTVTITPTMADSSRSAHQSDPLLHAIEARRGDARRAGNEVVMEGRRQHRIRLSRGPSQLFEQPRSPIETAPATGPSAGVRPGRYRRLLHPPIPRADHDGRVLHGENVERRGGLYLQSLMRRWSARFDRWFVVAPSGLARCPQHLGPIRSGRLCCSRSLSRWRSDP